MSFSINTVTSDGVETQFPISFTNGIYNRASVKVYVQDDLDGGGVQLERSFTWINDGIVELDVAAPTGKTVTIQRIMSKTEPDVNYVNGAILDETNLNQSLDQLLAITHEILDGVGIDRFNQDVDMGGYRLTNLGQGTDDTDGVTLAQVRAVINAASTGLIVSQEESQTGAQIVANVSTLNTISFVQATGNLYVFRNGNKQKVGRDYLEGADGVSITWIDNIPNANDDLDFINNLATTNTTTNTAGITHSQSGTTYNLATYLQNRHEVNVKDYGADPSYTAAVNAVAFQAALDTGFPVFVPSGVYTTTKLTLNQGAKLFGSHHSEVTIKGDSSTTTILEIDNSGGFTNSLNITIENITFDATTEAQTTAIRGASDTIYIGYVNIEKCFFSLPLEYGCYGNFIQCNFDKCTFGYFGSATTAMTTSIYLNGQSGTEANNNNITECYVANVSGEGIYISTGWANKIINTTIEVCGKEALVIDGGLQTTISGLYIERAWEGHTSTNTEALIRTANNATTGDTIAAVMVDGGFYQTSAGMAGGYFIDCAGSAIVSISGAGFGSLGTHAARLSSNNDKVIFGDDNYYPGGFTSFTAPNVVLGGATTLYKNFHETNDSASEAVKILKASHATYATSLVDLQAERAASSAYNFMTGRSDVSSGNVVQHQLVGNGEAYHRSGVGGGSYTTGTRPTPANAGTMIWDSTLSKPIWWNGAAWEDATGATV